MREIVAAAPPSHPSRRRRWSLWSLALSGLALLALLIDTFGSSVGLSDRLVAMALLSVPVLIAAALITALVGLIRDRDVLAWAGLAAALLLAGLVVFAIVTLLGGLGLPVG